MLKYLYRDQKYLYRDYWESPPKAKHKNYQKKKILCRLRLQMTDGMSFKLNMENIFPL